MHAPPPPPGPAQSAFPQSPPPPLLTPPRTLQGNGPHRPTQGGACGSRVSRVNARWGPPVPTRNASDQPRGEPVGAGRPGPRGRAPCRGWGASPCGSAARSAQLSSDLPPRARRPACRLRVRPGWTPDPGLQIPEPGRSRCWPDPGVPPPAREAVLGHRSPWRRCARPLEPHGRLKLNGKSNRISMRPPHVKAGARLLDAESPRRPKPDHALNGAARTGAQRRQVPPARAIARPGGAGRTTRKQTPACPQTRRGRDPQGIPSQIAVTRTPKDANERGAFQDAHQRTAGERARRGAGCRPSQPRAARARSQPPHRAP
jgi:hypothetical protein